ncbi:uncharacterized protein PV07_01232 [Cladophialophora immunda]|uniref:Uncharacterized protein n=1 Tax=Cladophialophora immunda TaxID=569365 RepID=A0A0D2DFI5_9EURO|nr:uncharacterized protein PV07_01232 [Cladophialophora immunda]KIW34454.1 hypothetical protein PV07_01232 [Cladophialophora immunda]
MSCFRLLVDPMHDGFSYLSLLINTPSFSSSITTAASNLSATSKGLSRPSWSVTSQPPFSSPAPPQRSYGRLLADSLGVMDSRFCGTKMLRIELIVDGGAPG